MKRNQSSRTIGIGDLTGILAITAALCAVLLPSLGAARQNYDSKICIDNVKISGLALQMYTLDFDERLPRARSWMTIMAPYTKDDSCYRCPTLQAKPDKKVYGYALDSRLSTMLRALFANPAGMDTIYDSSSLSKDAADPFKSVLDFNHKRHEGVVIGFLDGHVKVFEGENVITAELLKLAKAPAVKKVSFR